MTRRASRHWSRTRASPSNTDMPTLDDLLKDGRKHAVSEEDYDYFLGVLPPVAGPTSYLGERWDFGFAEGAERVRFFKHERDGYFAIETPYLNPREAGPIG